MLYKISATLHGTNTACFNSLYSAFTETGATQTMKTNQKAELKQYIPTFSNSANQMSSTKQ